MAHTFFIVLAYEYHFPAHIIPFRMFSPTSCCPFSYGASKQAIREMEICCYEGFTGDQLVLLAPRDGQQRTANLHKNVR